MGNHMAENQSLLERDTTVKMSDSGLLLSATLSDKHF